MSYSHANRSRRKAARRAAVAVGLVPMAMGALAGTGLLMGQAGAQTPRPATAAAHTKVTVEVVTVPKYGKVLVDQKGLPLYYDTADRPPSHWACTGDCLTAWPPLVLPKGQAKAAKGPGAPSLGVVKSPSGEQVTWKGRPLYTYITDSKDKVTGQGVGHVWYVVQLRAGSGTASAPKGAGGTTGSGGVTTTTAAGWVTGPVRPSAARWATNLLIWSGSLLVLGSSVLHYYLWHSRGYNHIPTIGPLFLAQAVAGVVLATWTSVSRHWLLAIAEGGFASASAGGLIISVNFGLFGWQEQMSAPYAGMALSTEIAAATVLFSAVVLQAAARRSTWKIG